MSVTRDEVVNAYLFILGRMPESEKVIIDGMANADFDELRRTFLTSDEFTHSQVRRNAPPSVGRFFDAHSHGTKLTCTGTQVNKMLARIASAWREFGETEPHWSVLTDDEFKQENIEDNIDAFYASGPRSLDIDLNFLRRSNQTISFGRALDFGCGVGRLTLALSPHADAVHGVDISEPHVRLAVEQANLRSIDNVTFNVIDHLEDLLSLGKFDFIISKIVLQHNPPPIMAMILRYLLTILNDGGSAIIQLPTFIARQRFEVDEYLASEQPKMEMNALPQQFVFEIIEETGCRCLEVREDNEVLALPGVSQTFAIKKI